MLNTKKNAGNCSSIKPSMFQAPIDFICISQSHFRFRLPSVEHLHEPVCVPRSSYAGKESIQVEIPSSVMVPTGIIVGELRQELFDVKVHHSGSNDWIMIPVQTDRLGRRGVEKC